MIFRRLASPLLALLLTLGSGMEGRATPTLESVTREPIDVPGASEPHTPAPLNRALAFRYYEPHTSPPSLVLVLCPGLHSGPNTLDILARALLATHGPGLEVWVFAPRAALLQDRRGVDAALDYRNPDFALGYYYGNLTIDGHRFHRLTPTEIPYAAYWGLDVHLRDIRAIVHEARTRYPSADIVLGGHSLGGVLTALYAGYDFGRMPDLDPPAGASAPEDVGARDLSGLLFLDGLPLEINFRVTPARYFHGFWIPRWGSIPGLAALTAADSDKRAGPLADIPRLSRTKESILFDVISVYAYLRPGAASYFPFYPRRGVPITNEALVATVLSDQMQINLLIRAAVETPRGVFQRVPDPANINPRGLLDLQSGRPVPGETLIRMPPDDPDKLARVNLRALLTAILRPGASFTQWYIPWRLVLDLGLAATLDTSDTFSRQFMSLTHVAETTLPILIIGAGHGLIQTSQMTEFYRSHIATPPANVSVTILPGYTHLDIEDAAPNPAVPLILDWLKTTLH